MVLHSNYNVIREIHSEEAMGLIPRCARGRATNVAHHTCIGLSSGRDHLGKGLRHIPYSLHCVGGEVPLTGIADFTWANIDWHRITAYFHDRSLGGFATADQYCTLTGCNATYIFNICY